MHPSPPTNEDIANIEAQLKAPLLERSLETSSAISSQSPTCNANQPAESIIDLNNASWSASNDLDFNNITADFQFMMDSRDWPDTSNAIITMPIDLQLPPEVDKFPDLSEVQEL